MVYEISKLTQLDATKVTELLTHLEAEITENNPKIDLKRGVFHDTVMYYHALLESAIRENLDIYQSARSLQQIEADPTIADTSTVSDVLSNWGITRDEGTKATGEIWPHWRSILSAHFMNASENSYLGQGSMRRAGRRPPSPARPATRSIALAFFP